MLLLLLLLHLSTQECNTVVSAPTGRKLLLVGCARSVSGSTVVASTALLLIVFATGVINLIIIRHGSMIYISLKRLCVYVLVSCQFYAVWLNFINRSLSSWPKSRCMWMGVDVVEKEPRSEINRGAVEWNFDWHRLYKNLGKIGRVGLSRTIYTHKRATSYHYSTGVLYHRLCKSKGSGQCALLCVWLLPYSQIIDSTLQSCVYRTKFLCNLSVCLIRIKSTSS